MDDPFSSCGTQLAIAQNPKIEIVIRGERHDQPETRTGLIRRTNAGEINLLVESSWFGEDLAFSHIAGDELIPMHVKPDGPTYGVEDPDAASIAMCLGFSLPMWAMRETTFSNQVGWTQWLSFVTHIQAHPNTWREITKRPDLKDAKIVALVNRLIALPNQEIWETIVRERAVPDWFHWEQILRIYALHHFDKLSQKRPTLRPWLDEARKIYGRQVDEETMIKSVAILNSIRERFVAENLARIIAQKGSDQKPYYFIFGGAHVELLGEVIRENMGTIPNLTVTVHTTEIDEIAEEGNQLRASWRPK